VRIFFLSAYIATVIACASNNLPPTGDFAVSYSLIENAEIGGGEIYAPDLMQQAKSFYDLAEAEFTAGNYEESESLRQVSEIIAKTVISISRKKIYEDEIERLRSEINEANSIKRKREAELRENILKLGQIKDRIVISQEIMHSSALDKLEEATQKIKAAEALSAEYLSPQLLNDTNENYKAAEEYLNKGENEKSIERSQKSISIAERAIEESKKKLELTNEIQKRLSSIYGTRVENIKGVIKVTFQGLFAPSSSNILYDAYPSLDAFAGVLSQYPALKTTIQANPDHLENQDKNIGLSVKRVEAVTVYLVSKGISTERLRTGSAVINESPADTIGDRRIEFFVTFDNPENIQQINYTPQGSN